MPNVMALPDELECVADMLEWLAAREGLPVTVLARNFPRTIILLRSRARAIRNRREPHKAAHKVVFAGKKTTKGTQITNADALRKIRGGDYDLSHGD